MKQRQRKRKFNFAHRVKTFRVTSEMADLMNSLGVSARAAFFGHALHNFIAGRNAHISRKMSLK